MAEARNGLVMSGLAAASGVVSSSDLHARTREAIARVQEAHSLAVTHYNEVDAYLVSPDRMHDLLRAEARDDVRARELTETLPLLLAAARVGVAVPSETLERFAPGLDASWQAVAEFAARFPVRIHAGEDGEPIARGRLRSAAGAVLESGDDDELNLDA